MGSSGLLIFFVLVAAAVFEFMWTVTWYPPYFRYGVPIYLSRIPCPSVTLPLPSPNELSGRYKARWDDPPLFRSLSATEIGFRDPLFEIRPFSAWRLTHGLIELRQSTADVLLVGYVNLTMLLLGTVVLISLPMSDFTWMLWFLVPAVALWVFVIIQQYRRVGRMLAEAIQGRS